MDYMDALFNLSLLFAPNDSPVTYTPRTLAPVWPMARELYLHRNDEITEHDTHGE